MTYFVQITFPARKRNVESSLFELLPSRYYSLTEADDAGWHEVKRRMDEGTNVLYRIVDEIGRTIDHLAKQST